MSKITNEMHKLLGEAAKSPDTAEIKHAKKQYMHMPEAMSMLNDMMDALSNINDPRAREAMRGWLVRNGWLARDEAARLRHYAPQLNTYALALSRILGKPVTRRQLCFLHARRTMDVK